MLLEQLLDSEDDFLSLVNNNWCAFMTGWQIIMQGSCRHHKTRVSYASTPIPRLVPRALNVTVLSRMIGGSMWQKSLAAPLALLEASVTLLPFCFLGVCGLFPVPPHLTQPQLSALFLFPKCREGNHPARRWRCKERIYSQDMVYMVKAQQGLESKSSLLETWPPGHSLPLF